MAGDACLPRPACLLGYLYQGWLSQADERGVDGRGEVGEQIGEIEEKAETMGVIGKGRARRWA